MAAWRPRETTAVPVTIHAGFPGNHWRAEACRYRRKSGRSTAARIGRSLPIADMSGLGLRRCNVTLGPHFSDNKSLV